MTILNTTITTTVIPEKRIPIAEASVVPAYGIIGSVIRLKGGQSSDPFDASLTYQWSFKSTPIGSTVAHEGFRDLAGDMSEVSFSPDIVGEYVVSLTVSNGTYDSDPFEVRASIRAILVPHGRGIVPDGKFIWSYIRDVWAQVDSKEWFETFWSALMQIAGADLLKLYQNDFAKSIRDIQDLYQRRWLKYEPKLDLVDGDCSFFLGHQAAGTNATTTDVSRVGQAIILHKSSDPVSDELVVVLGPVLPKVSGEILKIFFDSKTPGNVGSYTVLGTNAKKTGYLLQSGQTQPDPTAGRVATASTVYFSFQSKSWTIQDFGIPALLNPGDIFHIPLGVNTGFYRILSKVGAVFQVDHAPPSFSDVTMPTTNKVDTYRPVGIEVSQASSVNTDTLAIPFQDSRNDPSSIAPGRIILVGGQAFTVLRTNVDYNQPIPLTVITTDESDLFTGMNGVSWRTPYTLVSKSQNFSELGVSSGDLLIVDIVNDNSGISSEFHAQVIGVDRNRLGFYLTDQDVAAGEIPAVPDQAIVQLSKDFGIQSVRAVAGSPLTYLGDAELVKNILMSGRFRDAYHNKELTSASPIVVHGGTFYLHPRSVIRNRLIPVAETLRSIPVLQDWIVQPSVTEHDGKIFQEKNGKEYQIARKPTSLVENTDFLVDSDVAFEGSMAFDTGTSLLDVENGLFLDMGLSPGDTFSILEPVTLRGDYGITAVFSQSKAQLSATIPLYVLNKTVLANVRITRKRTGHFLRFVPGLFVARDPAPDRYWAEVSLFDNNQTIENNFGILVGLKSADLLQITEKVNYRQAVSGMMYAFTRGPAVDRVRLGAQILLGLPFSEHRGIIRSLENDYRLDAHGNPIQGRLLIEDVDASGTPLGVQRVYTFPVDSISSLAGVDVNPATGNLYTVGDIVEIFSPLCKGVEVSDYVNDPNRVRTSIGLLRQFHSVRVLANDNIFTLAEMAMVSSFLRKITPSYVSATLGILSEFSDTIAVTDSVKEKLIFGEGVLVDNPYFALAHAIQYDGKDRGWAGIVRWNDGMYEARKSGTNLVTLAGAGPIPFTGYFSGGGFLEPLNGEGPVTRPGDVLVILNGLNQGTYVIDSVLDGEVHVVGPITYPIDLSADKGFVPATNQLFAVLRPVKALITSGSMDCAVASDVISENPSLGVNRSHAAHGVASGDWIVFDNNGSTAYVRHTVLRVGPNPGGSFTYRIDTNPINDVTVTYPTLAAGEMQIYPAAAFNATARPYWIYRSQMIESPFNETISNAHSYGNGIVRLDDHKLKALIDIGDEISIPILGDLRLTAMDPIQDYYRPIIPVADYTGVRIHKKGHAGTPVGFDHVLAFGPGETVEVTISETNAAAASYANGSDQVTLQIALGAGALGAYDPAAGGVLPGDILLLPNSTVDVGWGLGIYPIAKVTPAGVFTALAFAFGAPLTRTDSWKIIRRR